MTLQFPWPEAPGPARLARLNPALSWLRMPLPFALNHVNVWILDAEPGPFIVDSGINTPACIKLWEQLLPQFVVGPTGLLITHYHPDHVGLAGWLAERYHLPVWFSEREWQYSTGAYGISDKEFSTIQDNWFQRHGLDTERRSVMQQAGNTFKPCVHPLPASVSLLKDGDNWTAGRHDWRVITVGGHAPEMICLYAEHLNVLLAADQVLPSITPNISLNAYSDDPDPLQLFLESISRLEQLPADVLVLPSHGLPYYGLHTRIKELRAHHAARFDQLLSACKTPSTAADMLPVLFPRKLDFQQLMFAMGESIAHLQHLALKNELQTDTDLNGVQRYHRG